MASAVLTSPSEGVANDGHDNANSDLILFRGMELEDPDAQCAYEILEMLGQGTFGQVVKCARIGSLAGLSMGTPGAGYMGNGGEEGGIVAVKVIKNQPAYYHQALVEVSVLKLVSSCHTLLRWWSLRYAMPAFQDMQVVETNLSHFPEPQGTMLGPLEHLRGACGGPLPMLSCVLLLACASPLSWWQLNERYDPHDTHHIVRLIDHFVFRKHLCIVFELLTFNL